MHLYWVYILASRPQGTLYIGVTNSIVKRVTDHRAGIGSKFTRTYKVHMLVWYEELADPGEVIQCEKNLKHYVRDWKINLIEHANPQWLDLFPGLPGAELVALT
jgi:putative endonuclease